MSNFSIENKEGYSIIRLNTDRLDNQITAELRSELVLLAGKGVNTMILDLSNCTYCDTAGLSAILIAHRLCKDGSLVLVGVAGEVANMLSIQRFDPELILESSVADAEERLRANMSA